jgi:hypothetical protein
MWRVIMAVIAVLVIDLLILFVGAGPLDENMNMRKISSALRAREENPTPETQRAVIAALDEGYQKGAMKRIGLSVVILVVTGTGLFIAGRWFERRRWQALMSTAPINVARHI